MSFSFLRFCLISSSVILLTATSCKNSSNEKDEILQKFDSVNKELQKATDKIDSNNKNTGTDALYDSVAMKYTQSMMQEFKTEITDFKVYLHSLKTDFIKFCGGADGQKIPAGKEDNADLTKSFFKKNDKAEELYLKLSDVQKTLSSYNDDPSTEEEITEMVRVPKHEKADKFYKLYFDNTPPVAALTILTKFETDVNMFEKKIVSSFLNGKHDIPQ